MYSLAARALSSRRALLTRSLYGLHHQKRKRSSSSVLAEEHTVDNSEKKNIRVRGVSDQFLAEQISKPIVYANDMAKFKMVQSNAHLIDQTCALRAPIPVMS